MLGTPSGERAPSAGPGCLGGAIDLHRPAHRVPSPDSLRSNFALAAAVLLLAFITSRGGGGARRTYTSEPLPSSTTELPSMFSLCLCSPSSFSDAASSLPQPPTASAHRGALRALQRPRGLVQQHSTAITVTVSVTVVVRPLPSALSCQCCAAVQCSQVSDRSSAVLSTA